MKPIAAFATLTALMGAAPVMADPTDRPYTGEHVYMLYCQGCHKPGPEAPGTRVLAGKQGWEKAPLKGRTDLDPTYVKHVVRHGLLEMAPLRPSDINDEELDRLIEYLRTPGEAPLQPDYKPS